MEATPIFGDTPDYGSAESFTQIVTPEVGEVLVDGLVIGGAILVTWWGVKAIITGQNPLSKQSSQSLGLAA